VQLVIEFVADREASKQSIRPLTRLEAGSKGTWTLYTPKGRRMCCCGSEKALEGAGRDGCERGITDGRAVVNEP
jgi:hypothetical protein